MPTVAVKRKNYNRSIRSYIVAALVLLIGAGVYGYFQYIKLAQAQEAIAQEEQSLDQLTKTMRASNDEFNQAMSAYQQEFNVKNNQIKEVFPLTENYTDLTIVLDELSQKLNENGEFFIGNISYGVPQNSQNSDYMILPINMNMKTTRNNLENFLTYVFNSGDLNQKVRLLDIQSINLGFSAAEMTIDGVLGEPLLNIDLRMNSFFQKPTTT